jgi:hypothetical protein
MIIILGTVHQFELFKHSVLETRSVCATMDKAGKLPAQLELLEGVRLHHWMSNGPSFTPDDGNRYNFQNV